MRKRIRARTAGALIIAALTAMLIVHLLILTKVVPSDIVWGGAIGDDASKLAAMEGFALAATVLFIGLTAWRIGWIGRGGTRLLASIGSWIVFVYFLLNTIGNLASGVTTENALFAPVTAILTLLAYRVAIEKLTDRE